MQFQMEKEKNVFTGNHEEKNNKTLGPQRLKQCVRFQPHNQTPTSYIKFKMFLSTLLNNVKMVGKERRGKKERGKKEKGKNKRRIIS